MSLLTKNKQNPKTVFMKRILEIPTFQYDHLSGCVYGFRYGFTCVLKSQENNEVVLLLAASKNEEMPDVEEIHQAIRNVSGIMSIAFEEYRFLVRFVQDKNPETQAQIVFKAMDELTYWLRENGYFNCSELDGVNGFTKPCSVRGSIMLLDENGYRMMEEEFAKIKPKELERNENIFAGVVGAFLGSLIGVLAIVLIGQLGYVAVISGFVMAFCCIRGYQLLAGNFSIKGVIVCSLIMILMVYVAKKVDWAITIASELEIGFLSAYQAIPNLLMGGVIELPQLLFDFGLVYLFTALGAIPFMMNEIRQKNAQSTIRKFA